MEEQAIYQAGEFDLADVFDLVQAAEINLAFAKRHHEGQKYGMAYKELCQAADYLRGGLQALEKLLIPPEAGSPAEK
jgi:hypothetical protein